MAAATEAGERLWAGTAASGREAIRARLRTVRSALDALYDNVSAAARALEVQAVHRDTLEESARQLGDWLASMEAQTADTQNMLHATLDDKKAQLHTYRVSSLLETRNTESIL